MPAAVFMASSASSVQLAGDVAARLQQLAGELALHARTIADVIAGRVAIAMPELIDDEDPTVLEAVHHSTQANVGAILSMLAYGIPGTAIEPSAGALELFERLAERPTGLLCLLRTYRIMISELWQIWAEFVHDACPDKDTHDLVAAGTSHMLSYSDRMCEQLAEMWSETRRRLRLGLDVPAEDIIRRALFGEADAAGSLARLGYDESRVHVAFALPPTLSDDEVMRLTSRTRLHGQAQTITLPHDRGWVAWVALPSMPSQSVLDAVEGAFGVDGAIGRGELAAGLDGFRATHREAVDARRVGLLRGASGVTRYRDVALLSVLCADTVRARALARTELGPLAEDDQVTLRLRETLAAYFASGESYVATAERLYVHQKTVAYRIRQTEKLLGRRVGDRRAELEAALLLHHAFTGQV